jgi:hypothetical protein
MAWDIRREHSRARQTHYPGATGRQSKARPDSVEREFAPVEIFYPLRSIRLAKGFSEAGGGKPIIPQRLILKPPLKPTACLAARAAKAEAQH